MIKSVIALGCAAVLLSGCAALQERRLPSLAEIKGATVAACTFLPDTDTVTALLAASIPGLTTAKAFAKAICEAITPKPSTVFGTPTAPPMVSGVIIRGRYVQ